MHRNEVGFKFTVWVGKYSPEMTNQIRAAALVRAEEEAGLIIIISVKVIPDKWRSFYTLSNIFYGLSGDSL